MQSANFVFSRLLLKLHDQFPIACLLSLKDTRIELEVALIPDFNEFSTDEAVSNAISFLHEEGFIRFDDQSEVKDGSVVYKNCRLTKRGLAMMTGAIPERFHKSADPRRITLIEYMKAHAGIEHLDKVGIVITDAFVRH